MNVTRVFTSAGRGRAAGCLVLVVAAPLLSLGYCAAENLSGEGRPPVVSAAPEAPLTPLPTPATRAPRTTTPDDTPARDDVPDPEVVNPDGHATTSAAAVAACASAAHRFGSAYAARPGDTRDAWTGRVETHVTVDFRRRLDGINSLELGTLPRGNVEDVTAVVDGPRCDASVEYADGSTLAPTLRPATDGRWVVTTVDSLTVEGGQTRAVGPLPTASVSAPGPNEFQ